MSADQMLTSTQLAKALETNRNRVNALAASGIIPSINLNPGGKRADRRFDLTAVKAALAEDDLSIIRRDVAQRRSRRRA